jgi:hypothetical protein
MRLLRPVLLAALVAVVVVVTAAAGAPHTCTHGASSIGPAVLNHNHLARGQSNLTPHTEVCLPRRVRPERQAP